MGAERLLIAMSQDGRLRARALIGTELVQTAVHRHHPTPLAARALGRATLSAALFPLSWKEIDRVSMQWTGRGPLGSVVADFRKGDFVRAMVANPSAVLADQSRFAGRRGVGYGLLPQGYLSVIRQRPSGHFDRGQVALVSGEIDEDLAEFFLRSDQQPTRLFTHVALGDNGGQVEFANGLLVQRLPGEDWGHLPDLAELDREVPIATSAEALLDIAFGGSAWTLLEERSPRYQCTCSRERFADGLLLLTAAELAEMIDEGQGAKLRCDFCATAYTFDQGELEMLFTLRLEHEHRSDRGEVAGEP